MRKHKIHFRTVTESLEFSFSTFSDQDGFSGAGVVGGKYCPILLEGKSALENWYQLVFNCVCPDHDSLERVEDGNVIYIKSDQYSTLVLTVSQQQLFSDLWQKVLALPK